MLDQKGTALSTKGRRLFGLHTVLPLRTNVHEWCQAPFLFSIVDVVSESRH
ncbi:hypothetical protein AM1BK_31530 [Neobacillus kokaensis]|uniref:Uncharacterized protein n=1 Tax=Neobacillus kokaensis TaxID=2759023 RepID=A0ABQ3N9W1_9BACI|nr:hypothetical protein AM1BK_31530 [Neobacillus kokaensis]